MRIVINHLTRMRSPMICVAGLTRDGNHVRPIPAEVRLNRTHLLASGGMFEIGAVVELGEVEDVGLPPEREDRLFALASAKYEFHLESERFWAFLLKCCQSDLLDIFGSEIARVGSTMAVPLGTGKTSLGCLNPLRRPRLYLDDRGRVRARVENRGMTMHIPVTDIRLYKDDHTTVHQTRLAWLNNATGSGAVLAVGLGCPYKGQSRAVEEHWLQINNIHPRSDPLWVSAPD